MGSCESLTMLRRLPQTPRRLLRRGRGALNVLLMSVPPIFNIGLVSLLSYYTVHHNNDSVNWALFAAFIDAQLLFNWIQFLRFQSIIIPSKRNFPGYVHRYPSLTNSKDPREINDEFEEARRTWKECDACDMHIPQRTYHCSLCNACISIPDHHCYFLGRCVGRANQRFFICFAFYACIGSFIGVHSLIQVMSYYRNYATLELFYYLLPFLTVAYFAGYGGVQTFELLYVGLIDFGIGSFLFTGFLVVIGLNSVFTGSTPRESKRKVITDDMVYLTKGQRFRNVFGPCGLLHFLSPFLPFECPRIDDGYRRIITYNSDCVVNGVVIMNPNNHESQDIDEEQHRLLDNGDGTNF